MACDLALRLMGGCPPDFAGGPVTLRPRPFRSIAGTARWAISVIFGLSRESGHRGHLIADGIPAFEGLPPRR